jgi:hypothetical protein
MRAAPTLLLLVGCGGDPSGGGKGPGGVDATPDGDSGLVEDDTGGALPLAPAWVQLGNTRVRATHVSLEAAGERRAATTPTGLSLTSRGWPEVGFGGAVATPDGVSSLDDLEVDASALVDPQAFVEGRLVPPDPCEPVDIVWTPPEGELTDVGLGLAPIGGQNCDVSGTTRPPLLTLGFGSGGSVSFSGDVLSLSIGDPEARCTLRAINQDEETLAQEVDCGLTVGWEDGEADAVPGGARLQDGALVVGVVAGSESLVGRP